tara:strand:- start:1995 stop:2294 length:300 start_codon:yes stop_codon:yes gene_type:complete
MMKFVVVFLHLLNGEVAQATFSATLPYWQMKTCSQMIDSVTRFEENPNYKAGNGQTWIYRKYKNNIVLLHYCKTDKGQWYNWPPGMEEAYIKGLREKIE